MNNDKFFGSLHSLINEGRLSHVIKTLSNHAYSALPDHPDMSRIIHRLDRISETYSHMRQFLIEGIPDPQRNDLYNSLVVEVKNLARDYLFILNENRSDPFFAEYRIQKMKRRSLADLIDELNKNDYRITMANVTEADSAHFIKKKEDLVSQIFKKIWSLPPWESDERGRIKKLLSEETTVFEIKSQIVSALLIGLLRFFDPGKLSILIDTYNDSNDERLSARILTSIVLVLSKWGESALASQDINEGLLALSDSILNYTRLRDVIMTLIKTRDTDRVSREVNEAFQTTMREINPEILDKLRKEGMSPDSGDIEMNPEWEKLMKNKELEEKMQSLNEMQLEGLDVMMQTFSRLKSFPFFQSLPNWFLPFNENHSSVSELFDKFDSEALLAMADATDMCASDRFSFTLGIMQMPEGRRNLLASHLSSQLEGIKDMLKDRENINRKPVFSTEALVFARDLYRFAKLYPKRNEFYDPFSEPVDFLDLPLLGAMLSADEIKLGAADFYFQHGYYDLALSLYENMAASGKADRSLYEKIGFCYQMGGDLYKALEGYERADLFSSDADKSTVWLLKKLAFCNKALGRYEKAAEYYMKLIERNPDDLILEYHLGNVLLKAGKIKEAMEKLSKVHYHKPDHKGCRRAYLKGLLARVDNGDYNDVFASARQAASGETSELPDFRIAGHAAYLAGHKREAIEYYRKSLGDQQPRVYRKEILLELNGITGVDNREFNIFLDELESI